LWTLLASMQVDGTLRAYWNLAGRKGWPGQPGVVSENGTEQVNAEEGIKHFLDASKEALLEAEREFLSRTLAFLKVGQNK
jgi:hypothetical protein